MDVEEVKAILLILTTYLGDNPKDWILNGAGYIFTISGVASSLILLLTLTAKLTGSVKEKEKVSKIIDVLQSVVNILQHISLQPKSNELKDKVLNASSKEQSND